MVNPFIAARIPGDLNAALDAFAQASGVSRSTVVLDALRAYLCQPADLEFRVRRLGENAGISPDQAGVIVLPDVGRIDPFTPIPAEYSDDGVDFSPLASPRRICIECGAGFDNSDGNLCAYCCEYLSGQIFSIEDDLNG